MPLRSRMATFAFFAVIPTSDFLSPFSKGTLEEVDVLFCGGARPVDLMHALDSR